MSEIPAEFKLDPSNCIVTVTLYPQGESVRYLIGSTLAETLKLSKTLLGDIERKAIVGFVESLLVDHLLRGIDVTDESYCAGLAEALGIERLVVRAGVSKAPASGEPLKLRTRNQAKALGADLMRMNELGINLEEAIDALRACLGDKPELADGAKAAELTKRAKALMGEMSQIMHRWDHILTEPGP